jgi:hypothetical protein
MPDSGATFDDHQHRNLRCWRGAVVRHVTVRVRRPQDLHGPRLRRERELRDEEEHHDFTAFAVNAAQRYSVTSTLVPGFTVMTTPKSFCDFFPARFSFVGDITT